MSTVLHLPKNFKRRQRNTIASGMPADGRVPLARFTLTELSVVARFLDVAREDLELQLARTLAEPGMTPKKVAAGSLLSEPP